MKSRRQVLAIIGTGDVLSPSDETEVESLGRLANEAGFRVMTGGLDGVMAAACRGAHSASNYREGDTIGILPGDGVAAANEWVDIVIPSDLGIARNVLVVRAADVVIAVGGAAGTLSEIAIAWQLGRPLIALESVTGWAARLAGETVDHRRDDTVYAAGNAAQAVDLARQLLNRGRHG